MRSLRLEIFSSEWTPVVKFPGRYDSLVKISALVRQAVQEFGLDAIESYGVEIAVDEACSNIIEHAYGGEDKGEIEFDYKIEENTLIFTICDTGKGFNPNSIKIPRLDVPLKYRQKHGLGLIFMHQGMDEIRFDVVDHVNVLTMIKRKG